MLISEARHNTLPRHTSKNTGIAHSSRSWLLWKTDENDLNETPNWKETVSRVNSYNQYSHKQKQMQSSYSLIFPALCGIYHQLSFLEYITFEK